MANLKLASTDVSVLIDNFPNEQMRILRVISDYREMTVRTNGLEFKILFNFSQLFGSYPSFREVVIFLLFEKGGNHYEILYERRLYHKKIFVKL